MKKLILYILSAFVLVSCSSGEETKANIIPEKTMIRIYEDMFMADQWVITGEDGGAANNALLYEAVFNKYGYTTVDYMESSHHYMANPAKYAKILKKASARLTARKKAIEKKIGPQKPDLKKDITPEDIQL